MAKYYFQKDDEICYTIDYHLDYMREHGLNKMDVFEAKADIGGDFFYCQHFGEVSDRGYGVCDGCDHYQPRNGRNGICKSWSHSYYPTEKVKVLMLAEESHTTAISIKE